MDTNLNGIAIIGMSGRFPGAANVDEFWRNLMGGVESTSFFSDEELKASGLDVTEIRSNPNYVAARGIVDKADWFDAAFFNVSAKEAEVMDPQHRLLLEASWLALENAGYDPSRINGYVGVFAGMGNNTYYLNNLYSHPELLEQIGRIPIMLGNEKDFLATRIAYKLNLRGPALSTNTACSTSLVTVCMACQALLSYQCDLALAGGVSVSFPQKRANYHQEGGIFSPDGHCRPFDAQAAGTYFSDGLGMVTLKRLSEAVNDGDQIYAVIRGVGLNNDGADKVGFTAPSVRGQAEAIALALAHAGVDPASISYVEAHGTATPLGDPIEIAGLTQAFQSGTGKKNYCAIGSVKGNIGHLDSAAGVAGLIKATLALKHKVLPATLNFTAPNPKIDFANSPFFVNSKLTEWKEGLTPRRAGVSAFGIGGTNAHVVLEEAPAPPTPEPSRNDQLLLFSARSAAALDAATDNFLAHLRANPDLNLADAAFTLQAGRRVFPHRRMLVCRDVDDAIQALSARDPKRIISQHTAAKDCPVVFMFPGQGSQYVNMGADLYRNELVFQMEVDRCAELLLPHLGLDLRQILFPAADKIKQAEDLMIQSRIAQPALFVNAYALAKLWMSWGIIPQAMIGHSLGEYVAGCLAGVFTLEEALHVVTTRAQLVQAQPEGAMLAVRLAEKELTPLMPDRLSMAAINSPALCVVSGPHDAIAAFELQMRNKGVAARRLDASHAFHSAMMEPVVEPLAKLLHKVSLKQPAIPYVSNVTAKWVTPVEATDPHYWARHVRQTVRFADGVGELLKDPARILLEVGPGRALATFANQHADKTAERIVVSSILPTNEQEVSSMLSTLGRLWLAGKVIDWSGFYTGEKRQRITLPGYPMERKRFWVEPVQGSRSHASRRPSANLPADQVKDTRPDIEESLFQESVTLPMTNGHHAAAPAFSRKDRLESILKIQFQELSGASLTEVVPSSSFMEMGLDSLFLAQASQTIEKNFGVKVAFRQMLENLSTIHDLAGYLDQKLPSGAFATDPVEPTSKLVNTSPASAAGASTSTLDDLQAQLKTLTDQINMLRATSPSSTLQSNRASLVEPLAKSLPHFETEMNGHAEPAGPVNLPLTEPQEELWLASQAGDDASRAFNQVFAMHLPNRVEMEPLGEILQQLVDRHDSLRTTFAEDGSSQRILPSWTIKPSFHDLSALSEPEQEREISDAMTREDQTPFDLATGPLIRFNVLRLSGDRNVLIVAAHHIILDGWSIGILLRDFSQLYNSRASGGDANLAPAMQYQEYVQWQLSEKHGVAVKESEAYWLKRFAQIPKDFELPADRPRRPVKTNRAAEKALLLDSRLYDSMKLVAAKHDCTLVVFLLAAIKAWMFRLAGEEDVTVGLPAAGQLTVDGHEGNRSLVGHCVNALPLRSHCDGQARFSDHLKNVRSLLLDAYENQSITLGSLVRKLHLRTDPSRPPLVPLMFNLGRVSSQLRIPDGRVVFPPKAFTFFDLNIEAHDLGKSLRVNCRYNVDLFDDARIDRMLNHFRTMVAAAVAEPSRKVIELPLLTNTERHQIVVEWNRTEVNYPKDRCLHELIEDQGTRTPEAAAVVFGGQQLTYAELNAKANQLARHLQKCGVGPDSLVGICVERSVEMVIGLLGIIKAGGAYVPLDPEYPEDRLAYMLEDAAVKVLLTQTHLVEKLPSSIAKVIRLDADWPEIAKESSTKVESPVAAEHLAYMIYTSGSTGRPKGAMNTHQAIVNRLLWMQDEYQLTPADRVMQKTPFSFDVSVWEFFWPLLTGAALVVARPGGHKDPSYLAELIAKEKITTLHFVPSMLQVFLEHEDIGPSCSTLKRVICSGEALPLELQRRFFSTLEAELHNLYGPTEAAVDVTYWPCDRHSLLNTVPIGRPIANIQIYILDGQLQPVPIGVAGELHIGGIGLARGYHNRPELTAEKFIADPFSSDPKARLYKTGDSARFFPDGNIEYLGRLDHQIKIRGFRVELTEIEEVLNHHPKVQTSIVVAREDTPGDKRLVAYTVNRENNVSSAELREYLQAKLPDHMVPAAFVALEAIPVTPNGKADRKALPKPDFEAGADKSKFVAPSTPMEILLADIWREALALKQIGIHDNFFELGGHSMLAVRLIGKINKAVPVHLSVLEFFQNPTIKKLATIFDHENSGTRESGAVQNKNGTGPVLPFQLKGKRTPLFFLHGDWAGGGLYCGRLSQQIGEDQPFYALPPYRAGKDCVIDLKEMVECQTAVIKEICPKGPYVLGGFCIGATVAMEIARKLINEGETVEHLLLLDPPTLIPTWLRTGWQFVDRSGDMLKWNLLKKIHSYDRLVLSFARWLWMSPYWKIATIFQRLGLVKSTDYRPTSMGMEVNEEDADILQSLDYAIYFLAARLHILTPLPVPTTVYLPEETRIAHSTFVKRVLESFPAATVEVVPGDHLSCITKASSTLGEKFKTTLENIVES